VLWTIRRKVLSASLAMTLATAAFGEFAVHGIDVTSALVMETYDHSLTSIDYARAAAVAFAQMDAGLARRRLAGADPAAPDAQQTALLAATRQDLATASARGRSPAVTRAAQAADTALSDWVASRTGVPDWVAVEQRRQAVDAAIGAVINRAVAAADELRRQAWAEAGMMRQLTWMLLGLSVALSGSVALFLIRRIMGPVRAASNAASAIADGKLTTAIPETGRDELGQLLRAMARMRDAIRAMMEREIAQRRSAQGRLADALAHSTEGVMLVDPDGRLAAANARLAEFFPGLAAQLVPGAPAVRLIGAALARGLFATESATQRRVLGRQLLGLSPTPIEPRLRDGRWLRISRSPTSDGGMIAICSDITAVKQREEALQQANLYLDAALNNMIQGLCLFGPDRRLRLANDRFGEIMGLAPALLRPGTELGTILAASADAGKPGSALLTTLGAAPAGIAERRGTSPAERRLAQMADAPDQRDPAAPERRTTERRIQELCPGCVVEICRAPLPDGGWVATFEDVTERRASEARIAFLARHDALTELANRAQLMERLQDAVATLGRGEQFAVLCLDIDHFKAVNETLGHAYGDRLLQAAAERLLAAVRENDTVSRLGADEFAVILRDIERPEDAWELAERLLDALATPFDLEGEPVAIAASVGIAVAPADGAEGQTLLQNADTALHRAKQDGRGSYRSFEAGMDARLLARRAMELDLRRALYAGELAVHYQPLVDTRGQQVIGFEALLRWHHPKQGMIQPTAFIPLAEETGLIVPIGEWVLRTACVEAAAWPERLKVAVNVSPVQFQDTKLVGVVAEALAASGLPPDLLELEVTESVLLQNSSGTLKTLHQLHELGVRISMDDFGTGYSSLSYLRSFPFDKIKIDQSFVRDLSFSQDATAIIRAITAMGTSLGIRTTAEGVETEQQLNQLRAEGCSELQGYLFSRPIPPEDVPALIVQINGNRAVWDNDNAAERQPAVV
jgi:diguanylate cyclase (GGDEF)-like protein